MRDKARIYEAHACGMFDASRDPFGDKSQTLLVVEGILIFTLTTVDGSSSVGSRGLFQEVAACKTWTADEEAEVVSVFRNRIWIV